MWKTKITLSNVAGVVFVGMAVLILVGTLIGGVGLMLFLEGILAPLK